MTEQPARPPQGGAEWALGQVLALCVLAAMLAGGGWWLWSNWAAPTRGDSASIILEPRPVPANRATLAAAATRVGHEVYWLDDQPGRRMEVTLDGTSVRLRYLPAGEPLGSQQPTLSVGSYAAPNARAALRDLLPSRPGNSASGPGDTLVVTFDDSPTSVYVAAPGSDVLVEVFDPSPQNAWTIAMSGDLRPVTPAATP